MRREVAGGPGPKGKRGDPITGFLGISGPIGDKVLSQMPGSGWSASNRVAFGGDDKEDEKEGEGDGSDQVQEDDGNEDWGDEESDEDEEEEDNVDDYLDSSAEDSDDSNKIDY